MTTIAACLDSLSMAADAKVTICTSDGAEELHAVRCFKLWRNRRFIVGAAGEDTDIAGLRRWLSGGRRGKRPWSGRDFSALLLSRTALFYIEDGGDMEVCRLGYHAIGTGAGFALASMTTMVRMGLDVDVQVAVHVACAHDNATGEPVDVMSWAQVGHETPRSGAHVENPPR
jgi:hypothetical protein